MAPLARPSVARMERSGMRERPFGAGGEAHPGFRFAPSGLLCIAEASAAELLVLDPVRNGGVDPQSALLVFLVVLKVALEPFDVAVVLEGQDVGGDAVEEPAVVADDHRAAGEVPR